jgi:hypothetical protein
MKEQQNMQTCTDMVYIMGIMQRSGTNYLNNLLLLHPACEYPGIIWEDYLVAHADLLYNYTDLVYQHWHPASREKLVHSIGHNPVMRLLGEGLTSFFQEQFRSAARTGSVGRGNPEKLVTATPSVRNLDYFFDLFPDAYLLIIVRDGRSVVESGVKSFNWDYEQAMRNWAGAAEKILQFDLTMRSQNKKYLIMKYEDLVSHTREKMTEVLNFLNMDTLCYDFTAAENLGITGSSELREREGEVHWKARTKSKDFDPIKRWRHWGRPVHERFNWIAGDYFERFGYIRKEATGHKVMWKMWNKVLDFIFQLEKTLQQRNSVVFPLLKRLRGFLFSTVKGLENKKRHFEQK